MGGRQQMQFNRKAGKTPQSKTANPPIVLPAPEDGFYDRLPLFIDCLPTFSLEFLPNLADLRMIYHYFNAPKSTRMFGALCTKRTVLAIRATINLPRLPTFLMVADKRYSLPLRTDKFVLRLVVRKLADVIRCFFALTTFRIVQLRRSFRIRNYAIGFALGCFQHGIIGVISAVGYQLIRRLTDSRFDFLQHRIQLIVVRSLGRRFKPHDNLMFRV